MNDPIIVIAIIVFALIMLAIIGRIIWLSGCGKCSSDTIIELVKNCRTTLYVSQETVDAIFKSNYNLDGSYRLVVLPKEIAEALSLGLWKCLTEDEFKSTHYCPVAQSVIAFEREKKA